MGETFGNDGLDFYVSGNLTTPVVRIDANGRLGVGTLSPLYTLDVTGNAHVSGVFSGIGSGLTGITSSSLVAGSVTSTPTGQRPHAGWGPPTLGGDLNLPATTSAGTGVVDMGGSSFLHAYGANGLTDANTFVGDGAGNFASHRERGTPAAASNR